MFVLQSCQPEVQVENPHLAENHSQTAGGTGGWHINHVIVGNCWRTIAWVNAGLVGTSGVALNAVIIVSVFVSVSATPLDTDILNRISFNFNDLGFNKDLFDWCIQFSQKCFGVLYVFGNVINNQGIGSCIRVNSSAITEYGFQPWGYRVSSGKINFDNLSY